MLNVQNKVSSRRDHWTFLWDFESNERPSLLMMTQPYCNWVLKVKFNNHSLDISQGPKRKVSGLWSYKWIHLSINNSSDLRYSYLKLLFSTHGCTETRGSISYPNTWLDHLDSWFLRASVLHQPYHTMVKFATTNHTQVRFVHRKIYHIIDA